MLAVVCHLSFFALYQMRLTDTVKLQKIFPFNIGIRPLFALRRISLYAREIAFPTQLGCPVAIGPTFLGGSKG
jgi:hypothetical protein